METKVAEIYDQVSESTQLKGRAVDTFVARLEKLLKDAREQDGRLAAMVGRGFGDGINKPESAPEAIAKGSVGQMDTLLGKLAKLSKSQAASIARLEELL